MNDEEFEDKYREIVNKSLNELGLILKEVEKLNPIIKENQIRQFKKEWSRVFCTIDSIPVNELKVPKFRVRCKYLFNRMNDKNKIEEKILELTNKTKFELLNLK